MLDGPGPMMRKTYTPVHAPELLEKQSVATFFLIKIFFRTIFGLGLSQFKVTVTLSNLKDCVGQDEFETGETQMMSKSGEEPAPTLPVFPVTVSVTVPPRVAVAGLNADEIPVILFALALIVSFTSVNVKSQVSKVEAPFKSGLIFQTFTV